MERAKAEFKGGKVENALPATKVGKMRDNLKNNGHTISDHDLPSHHVLSLVRQRRSTGNPDGIDLGVVHSWEKEFNIAWGTTPQRH